MYSFIRKILFCLDPETAHVVVLSILNFLNKIGFNFFSSKLKGSPVKVMGLSFPNHLGLAAGLDKNGDYIEALGTLGFGFIEIGSVTPKPQSGNPKPRLFRLIDQEALINRMGFNSKGVDYVVEKLKNIKYKGILGVNIGKNRDTPIENALDDYVFVFRQVAPFANYVTINISSPNTEKLRDLQHGTLLQHLLHELKKEQSLFYSNTKKYVPLVVKISPDLTMDELKEIADIFIKEAVDGVIATNTTLSREAVTSNEVGGLSGRPLGKLSTRIIKELYILLGDRIPIIGCGGIMDTKAAKEKLDAGASLLQVYTGLIYHGPQWVATLTQSLLH